MIGRWWLWLTDAHRHEWETIDTQKIVKRNDSLAMTPKIVGFTYTLRCKSCGDITFRRMTIYDD